MPIRQLLRTIIFKKIYKDIYKKYANNCKKSFSQTDLERYLNGDDSKYIKQVYYQHYKIIYF